MKKIIQYIAVYTAIVFIFCSPKISKAQNNEADSLITVELKELIVTASRYKEVPFTVGRNVTVISQDKIDNAFHFNPGELLARQQSIHIVGNGQVPGSLTQGFLRGSNSNHFLVLINGIRVSDPSTVNNAVNLAELSLLGVKRIEVVRGSHSTLYGSSAIGGVINIITRKKGKTGWNIDIGTRNGVFGENTFSTSNNLMVNYTTSSGMYINAGIFQQYSNGFDATVDTVSTQAAFNPQDGDNFTKLDLFGRVGYKTDKLGVYLSYRNEDQEADLDDGAFDDDNNVGINFSRSLFSFGSFYEWSDQVKIEYKGAYSDISRAFVDDSSRISRSGKYDGTYVENSYKGSLFENSLTATYLGENIEAIAGIESTIQTMSLRTYIYLRSSFGVYENVTDLDSLDLRETITAGFLQFELDGGLLVESLSEFSLVLGGRILHHNEFGMHYTYEISPKYRPASGTLVYASLSTGFNAPSLYQLYSPNRTPAEKFARGNPNLKPEESISYEVGWKQKIGNSVNFEIALFKTSIDNIISYVYLWDNSVPIGQLSFAQYLGETYINLSEQNIKGIELGLNVRPVDKLSFGGNLTLMRTALSYSPDNVNTNYTNGNYVQDYNTGGFVTGRYEKEGLTRRPSFSAYLYVTYRPASSLKLKLSSRFVGDRDDVFYSASLGPFGALDRTNIDSYNVTNISAYYTVSRHISFGLQIENIFDTEYQEILGYNTQGRGIFLQLSYEFGSF